MGPGILAKAMLQGGFSLMVFGWTQMVMDLQPLVAIITGDGHLHGFTHTYIGSSLIAVFSAVTGKYTAELALIMIYKNIQQVINIRWRVAYLSAFIGAYSHVILDSIMHMDVKPLAPFSVSNHLLDLVSVSALHKFCIYGGLAGAVMYLAVGYILARYKSRSTAHLWNSE